MAKILSASVGKKGANRKLDVEMVQEALNTQIYQLTPLATLEEDGRCGPATVGAITEFQRRVLRHREPDGLIGPRGPTWKALGGAAATHQTKQTNAGWAGDSRRWSQDKKLLSLEPVLRQKVKKVLEKLKEQGYQAEIFYGWRSQAVQKKIIAKGNSSVKVSMHNITKKGVPNSYAADIIDKRYAWKTPDCMPFFKALGKEAKAAGLYWGGDWTKPDWAHVQSIPVSQQRQIRKRSN